MKKLNKLVLVLFLVSSCAVQQPKIETKQTVKNIEVPAGIDASFTVKADSIFRKVAVDEKEEKRAKDYFDSTTEISLLADSLWIFKESGLHSKNDTLTIERLFKKSEIHLDFNNEQKKNIKKLEKNEGIYANQVIFEKWNNLIIQIIGYYENAIRHNKFEIYYRQKFSLFLQDLSEKLNNQSYLSRAAEILETVVYTLKDKHQLYYDLAMIYFQLGEWNTAHKNFNSGKNALKSTAIFTVSNPDSYFTKLELVPFDTSRYVLFLNYQAQCKTKLYEAQPALALYREALDITSSSEYKKLFHNRIEWILWDDGNIKASELKDKCDTLRFIQKEYNETKDNYLELLKILWTKRTKDEINWSIAFVDFNNLNNASEGIERMFQVFSGLEKDSLTYAPVDTSNQRYFNTYGQMCFNLGNRFLEIDKLKSYIYFTQAANTTYDTRGKAFLMLASLSKFDPRETIFQCKESMKYVNDLTENEKSLLYQLLYISYRKLGDIETSKQWYDKSRNL